MQKDATCCVAWKTRGKRSEPTTSEPGHRSLGIRASCRPPCSTDAPSPRAHEATKHCIQALWASRELLSRSTCRFCVVASSAGCGPIQAHPLMLKGDGLLESRSFRRPACREQPPYPSLHSATAKCCEIVPRLFGRNCGWSGFNVAIGVCCGFHRRRDHEVDLQTYML